jgi:predicted dehydrogenase
MDCMTQESIGVALIGYGYVGQTFHAPLISATEGLKLAVVSSTKPDQVHQRYPAAIVAATPEAAITSSNVELVVIASPNDSHAPLAAAALRAGKHVVVDKPFTLTTAEARGLEKLAGETGRLLSVFHNRRWDADFLTLRQLIQAGKLDAINYFESHIDRFRPHVRDRWRERPGPGAGLWYDLGPHLIDQATHLFGPPETVQATILTQRPGGSVDDYAHVVLGYGEAVGPGSESQPAPRLQIVLHCTMLAAGGSFRYLVHGSAASWRKDGMDVQESQLLTGMKPGDAGWGVDPQLGMLYTGPAATPGTSRSAAHGTEAIPNLPGRYQDYYAAIRDAVLGRGPNPVQAAEAILVMAVLEAAIESSRRGARIDFHS